MFSAALEVVLTIALREAVSRRHAYLTLEHLLYALVHDPEGERILAAWVDTPGSCRGSSSGTTSERDIRSSGAGCRISSW